MRRNNSRSKPERRDDFDQPLRHAPRQFPRDVARELLRTQGRIEPILDVQDRALALAGADKRKRGFRDVVESLMPAELAMQSWIFKEGKKQGKKEGRAEGLQPLVHQFERRLGRALTPEEQVRLVRRLRADGPEKVGDVVLDLSLAELSAWLAPSNGHGR